MSISAIRASAATPHPMRRAGDIVIERDHAGTADEAAKADRVALTRTEPPLRSASTSSYTRPDASFVAHLIATAEQVPQTRTLRRADVANVEAAYRSVASTNVAGSPGLRTQRMV